MSIERFMSNSLYRKYTYFPSYPNIYIRKKCNQRNQGNHPESMEYLISCGERNHPIPLPAFCDNKAKERLSRTQSQTCLSYAEAMVFLGKAKERLAPPPREGDSEHTAPQCRMPYKNSYSFAVTLQVPSSFGVTV